MTDLLILFGLAAILNWAVVDAYFYNILFKPVHRYSERWEESSGFLKYFRYMLGCPFCFSHWTAATVMIALVVIGCLDYLPISLHPVTAIVFIPAIARVSIVIRDYTLPPIVNDYATQNETETSPESPREN